MQAIMAQLNEYAIVQEIAKIMVNAMVDQHNHVCVSMICLDKDVNIRILP